jgi:hypothetical protein
MTILFYTPHPVMVHHNNEFKPVEAFSRGSKLGYKRIREVDLNFRRLCECSEPSDGSVLAFLKQLFTRAEPSRTGNMVWVSKPYYTLPLPKVLEACGGQSEAPMNLLEWYTVLSQPYMPVEVFGLFLEKLGDSEKLHILYALHGWSSWSLKAFEAFPEFRVPPRSLVASRSRPG